MTRLTQLRRSLHTLQTIPNQSWLLLPYFLIADIQYALVRLLSTRREEKCPATQRLPLSGTNARHGLPRKISDNVRKM